MTLNSSGPISLAGTTSGQSIEVELGGNGTTQISLNDSAVRTLLGVSSGQIAMYSAYGKSNRASISYTFTTNTSNASLNVSSISGYISGKSDITVYVNSGVYLYATSTGNAGLSLSGGTSGDTLTLVNNGYIMGKGGDGATAPGSHGSGNTGALGGTGLILGFTTTVNNTNSGAYIGGGGGGGGSSATGGGKFTLQGSGGGGGAGGGTGGGGGSNSAGAGGCPGSSGSTASGCYGGYGGGAGGSGGFGSSSAGGGGGRIFPGSGASGRGCNTGGFGGTGNGAGGNGNAGGGGGGGWGASGGYGSSNCYAGGAGGSGGKAVNLNGYTITWVSGCTARIYGSVS